MATNHERWKVWKQQRWAPKPYWVVTSPEYSECGFRTHAEALAYADRMARIVEVTLPRVVDDCVPAPGSSQPAREATWIAPSRDGGCWVTMPTTGYVPIMVRKEELAPLALALLAHHYRQEAQ